MCSDASHHFIRDDVGDQAYFMTAMMDGLHYQSKLVADQDFGITVYPISAVSSHLVVRADVHQKRQGGNFEPVYSTNFYLGCRSRATHKKHEVPLLDFSASDNANLAVQR